MSLLSHYGHRYKVSGAEVMRSLVSNARIYRRPSGLPSGTSFTEKVAIVTGGNRGIGRKVCDILVQHGIKRLIIPCRDVGLGEKAAAEIRTLFKDTKSEIAVYKLDLSSKSSVKEFADKVKQKEPQVDFMINNAGIVCTERKETEDGDEMMMAVNYFGTVSLTISLMEHLRNTSSDPRILFTSSLAHTEVRSLKLEDLSWSQDKSFPFFQVYGHSKLALLLFVKKLAQVTGKQSNNQVLVYAIDPGVSKTDLGREANKRFGFSVAEFMMRGGVARPIMRSVTESATSVLLPLTFKREEYNADKYNFTDGRHLSVSPAARDGQTADRLWILTAEKLALDFMQNNV